MCITRFVERTDPARFFGGSFSFTVLLGAVKSWFLVAFANINFALRGHDIRTVMLSDLLVIDRTNVCETRHFFSCVPSILGTFFAEPLLFTFPRVFGSPLKRILWYANKRGSSTKGVTLLVDTAFKSFLRVTFAPWSPCCLSFLYVLIILDTGRKRMWLRSNLETRTLGSFRAKRFSLKLTHHWFT